MSDPQRNNLQRFSPDPMRQYARQAIAATKEDRRHGILAWRIATHLVNTARSRGGFVPTDLHHIPARDRDYYLAIAQAVIALTESIDGAAPPTPGEIARYEQRKSLSLARARAHTDAARLGHELDGFRLGDAGDELALCRGCGAGVSIHTDTAGIFASPLLQTQCSVSR